MIIPITLIRKQQIINKLLKKNAVSIESAVTLKEAGILSPNRFKTITLRLIEQGVLHRYEDKYYLDTAKL